MKSLAKNSGFNVLYTVLNTIFPLITSMYVSRILLDDGIGRVVTVQNIASYFIAFASLGLPVYGVRCIACQKNDNSDKIFSELFLIHLFSSAISIFGYIVYIFFIRNGRNDLNLYIACGLQVFLTAINIDWFYRGKEEYGFIVIRNLLIKGLSLIAIFLLVKEKDDYVVYALISSLAIAGNNIMNLIHAKKYVHISFQGINISKHIKPLAIFSINSLLNMVYGKIDITMLSIMGGDSSVGIYSISHKVVNLVLAWTTAITAVFLPRLSVLRKENRINFLGVLKKGTQVILEISIPSMVGIMILSPYVVTVLFGEAFTKASIALRLFSLLIIINSLGDLFSYQTLIAIGEERHILPITVIGTIVNILCNYLLIPVLGVVGAVIASIACELIINGYLFWFVIKKIKFVFPVDELLKCVFSSAIMGIGLFFVIKLKLSDLMTCVFGFIIGTFIYFLILYILKGYMILKVCYLVKKRIRNRKL